MYCTSASPLAVKRVAEARNLMTDLLRVLKVLPHGLGTPLNTLVDVGSGVRETLGLTGLSAKDTVQVGSDLVGSSSLESVALSTSGLARQLALDVCGIGMLRKAAICAMLRLARRILDETG
jgi:hypothetical protein